jgi:hypothetical protein
MKRVLCVETPIALGVLAMSEETLRDDQMKIVPCACHGDIKEASFFLYFCRSACAKVGRHAAVNDVQYTDFHSCPFAEWIVERIR